MSETRQAGFLEQSWVRALLSLFGAYFALGMCQRLWPPLVTIVTVLAGVFAVVFWILNYRRALAHSLYMHPIFGQVVDLVCKVSNTQPPADKSETHTATPEAEPEPRVAARAISRPAAKPSTKTVSEPEARDELLERLRNKEARKALRTDLGRRVYGHDANLERVIEAVWQSSELRALEHTPPAVPIGVYLFLGPAGVGKRHLAVQLGQRLYGPKHVFVLDCAGGAEIVSSLMASIRKTPTATLVLDNVDEASPRVSKALQAIATRGMLEEKGGGQVSCGRTFLFLLTSKMGSALAAMFLQKGGAQETELLKALGDEDVVGMQLASRIDEVFHFALPQPKDRAAVILRLMELACARRELRLVHVHPSVLLREVRAIDPERGFALAPGRIERRLKTPILQAIERNSIDVTVD